MLGIQCDACLAFGAHSYISRLGAVEGAIREGWELIRLHGRIFMFCPLCNVKKPLIPEPIGTAALPSVEFKEEGRVALPC